MVISAALACQYYAYASETLRNLERIDVSISPDKTSLSGGTRLAALACQYHAYTSETPIKLERVGSTLSLDHTVTSASIIGFSIP